MKIPQIDNAEKFQGLYIVDFGQYCSVGFTAEEVGRLLDSEKFSDIKVYKIHNAYSDGRMEIKGVDKTIFNLEKAMVFFSSDAKTAEDDYSCLVNLTVSHGFVCTAKIHLAKYSDDKFAVALIYPAEYDDEVSRWLLDVDYRTSGQVLGGIEAAARYYQDKLEILQRHQLFASDTNSRTIEQLLCDIKKPIQRFAS